MKTASRSWLLRMVFVYALLSAFCLGSVATALAAGTPDVVAFVRDDGVYSVQPDGSGLRKVGPIPALVPEGQLGGLSPAGPNKVLYSVAWSGDSYRQYILFDLSTGTQQDQIARYGTVSALAFSADGLRVAFVRGGRLYAGEVGAPEPYLQLGGDSFELFWAPDGSHLALTSDPQEAPDQLYLFELQSQKLTQLTDNQPYEDAGYHASIQQVAFTPDSKAIAFMQGRRTDGRGIRVMRLDGAWLRVGWGEGNGVFDELFADGQFGFTPSGALVFAAGNCDHANYQTEHRIYALASLSDATVRQVAFPEDTAADMNPAVAYDGGAIAYEHYDVRGGSSEVRSVDLAGSKVLVLSASGRSPIWVRTTDSATPDQATAVIDSINPNPPTGGLPVAFFGHGSDSLLHAITAYEWRDGATVISTAPSFSTAALAVGVHSISLRVQCAE